MLKSEGTREGHVIRNLKRENNQKSNMKINQMEIRTSIHPKKKKKDVVTRTTNISVCIHV